MRTGAAVLGALALFIEVGHANAADPAFDRLIGAKTLRCTIGKGAVANYKTWGEIEVANWGKNNTIHFDSINLKKSKARMIGNQGATDVAAFVTAQGVHFVEQTGSGNVHLMTVFAQLADRRSYKYVISRHISLVGRAVPSQYYGTCVVLE
jgi:hypothetical protein